MTKEEYTKEITPIIQTFAERKTIQDWTNDTWKDKEYTSFGELSQSPIKPEPKYRPFKTKEECWNEILKHQPVGRLKEKKLKKEISHISQIFETPDYVIIRLSNDEGRNLSSGYFFRTYTFADGAPFGIREEQQ